MNAEDLVLFACARQAFGEEHRRRAEELCRRGPIDWERLAGTAERHGVAPLAGANLRRCDAAATRLPPALAARFERALWENAAYKEREAARLERALARLRAAGLQALLLKGAALDRLVYERPYWTVSRDLDLAVRPVPGPAAAPPAAEGSAALRRALYDEGIECDFFAHHDLTMNGVLPVDFARVWSEARPVAVRGEPALAMAPEDLLLSLAINACRKRYFRLKALVDLAETVRRFRAELDWRRLGETARAWRAEGVALAALLATRATVGCDLPRGALDELGVLSARARLLATLVAALVRRGSLARLATGARGPLLGRRLEASLLLPYASLRLPQALGSLRAAVRRRPPDGGELRRGGAGLAFPPRQPPPDPPDRAD